MRSSCLSFCAMYLLFGDDAVAILVEDHEGELELVVLARTREVGEGNHELSDVNLPRPVSIKQLEQPFALG